MATSGDMERCSIKAGADLSVGCQFKALAAAGTIAAANSAAVGILQNKPKSGESASIAYAGHFKVFVGAAVSAGDRLKITTSGFAITVASGDGAFAKALTACASGGLCEMLGDFANAATTY